MFAVGMSSRCPSGARPRLHAEDRGWPRVQGQLQADVGLPGHGVDGLERFDQRVESC